MVLSHRSHDEWISKVWPIRTIKRSATQGNEELTRATTWMNLEKVTLSKDAGHKRPYVVSLHLYDMSRTDKPVGMEGRLTVSQGWGGWRE